MAMKQNIDVDKLEEFRSFLKNNPDKGKLRLEARAFYEGQAGRSTVHIGPYTLDGNTVNRETRHYTFPFGAWREVEETIGVGGPTDRMEPVEMTLAATAACVVNSISFNAVRMGIDAENFEIHVETVVDPRVLLGVEGPEQHSSCLGTVRYEVKVRGNVSDEQIDTIRKLCEHSPVHGMLVEPLRVVGKVTRA
jgi:uncharacterized OsmC-like protein